MKEAAVYDDVTPEFIREGIAKGQIVIYGNPNRKARGRHWQRTQDKGKCQHWHLSRYR